MGGQLHRQPGGGRGQERADKVSSAPEQQTGQGGRTQPLADAFAQQDEPQRAEGRGAAQKIARHYRVPVKEHIGIGEKPPRREQRKVRGGKRQQTQPRLRVHPVAYANRNRAGAAPL